MIHEGVEPFKHWYVDSYLEKEYAMELFMALSSIPLNEKLYIYDNYFEKKFASDRLELFPRIVKQYLENTLLKQHLDFLEETTGIKGLIADPNFVGGGFHAHKTNGVLRPHKDFTKHRKTGLIRKLNVILYLNRNWDESYGGTLELWNKDMTSKTEIEPLFNRLVIFETPDNIHGFSTPWQGPIPRMSLAHYLYVVPSLEDFSKEHLSTQFVKNPSEETSEEIEALRQKRNKGRVSSNV